MVRELHVINWSDAEVEPVPYRSITDYVVSSTKPRFVHHGIVGDDVFHSRQVAARYDIHLLAASCIMLNEERSQTLIKLSKH